MRNATRDEALALKEGIGNYDAMFETIDGRKWQFKGWLANLQHCTPESSSSNHMLIEYAHSRYVMTLSLDDVKVPEEKATSVSPNKKEKKRPTKGKQIWRKAAYRPEHVTVGATCVRQDGKKVRVVKTGCANYLCDDGYYRCTSSGWTLSARRPVNDITYIYIRDCVAEIKRAITIPTQEENKSEWKVWFGGKCPVNSMTKVDIVYRCGDQDNNWYAGAFIWEHNSQNIAPDYEIIAYKVVNNA